MPRTSYPAGPAYLTVGGITIELAEDWKVTHQIQKADMKTNLHGIVGSSEEYVIAKISGKPIATSANLSALLAFLFPYRPEMIGQLAMPDTDVPAIIQTRDGKEITFAACVVSKMPDITFAANTDIFGDFEITCIRAFGGDPTDPLNMVKVSNSQYVAPSMDPLSRIRAPYSVAWGDAAPFNVIETSKAGVKFSASVKLSPVEPDLSRLINYRIESVDASAKFTPLNLDADDFTNFVQLAGANSGVGKVLGTRGQQLSVTPSGGVGPRLVVPLSVPEEGPLEFNTKSRVGEITLHAHRNIVGGVLQPLFELSLWD